MPQDTRVAMSPQRVIRYTSGFQGQRIEFLFILLLFPVTVTSNPRWRQAAILDNFEWPYLRNGSFDPLI